MGLYDRDYLREDRRRFGFDGTASVVIYLVAANVVVFLADQFTPKTGQEGHRWLSDLLSLKAGTLTEPWNWWQFLTAGFVHSPGQLGHILFNMLSLVFLGRAVEAHYGPREFLRVYLAMLIASTLGWAVVARALGGPPTQMLLGASGAVLGTILLFCLNFPRQTILLFFVLPVPAWVVGLMLILANTFGQLNPTSDVAYSAHLAGLAFAAAYFYLGWNLGRLFGGLPTMPRLRRRPRLKVHEPIERERDDDDSRLGDEVDRILAKITREGESSLTARERKTLQQASRKYQEKRR